VIKEVKMKTEQIWRRGGDKVTEGKEKNNRLLARCRTLNARKYVTRLSISIGIHEMNIYQLILSPYLGIQGKEKALWFGLSEGKA
jgi:hypothetical protein